MKKSSSTLLMSLCILFFLLPLIASAETVTQEQVLRSIQENILVQDSNNALNAISGLNKSLTQLQNKVDATTLIQVQTDFRVFLTAWKQVEAVYTAGNIDTDMIDHPRYIDMFHTGSENIYKQLDRVFAVDTLLKTALFKNSTKTINALEYVLFGKKGNNDLLAQLEQNDKRRIRVADYIVSSLTVYLREIAEFYARDKQFYQQGKKSVEDIVNALIDSSYKLMQWRIADPGGFSVKYQNNPSGKRLEYYLSDNSLTAIQAILISYKKIFDAKDFLDLGDLGHSQNVQEQVDVIRKNINNAIKRAQVIQSPISNRVTDKEYKQLYQSLVRLHNGFYILLIEALGLTSKIIEADGD